MKHSRPDLRGEILRGRWPTLLPCARRSAFETEEIIDTGDELIVFVHEVARGRESGVVVGTDTAAISTFREGMIVRVRGFMHRPKALEAAGLRE